MNKSIEEQVSCRCNHFNGIQNLKCKIGIKYKDVRIDRPFKFPCLQQGGYCKKAVFPTDQEVKLKVKEINDLCRETINKLNLE